MDNRTDLSSAPTAAGPSGREVAHALRALAEQGRVTHPWLPGMRVLAPAPPMSRRPGTRAGRIIAASSRGIQWVEWEGGPGRRTFPLADTGEWELDLADPANFGCLCAIREELWGRAPVGTVGLVAADLVWFGSRS